MLYIYTAIALAFVTTRTPTWPSRHRDVDPFLTRVAVLRTQRSTTSSSSIWRPTSPWHGKTTGRDNGCQSTWSGSSAAILECGILAYGFARARCAECGHDFLVAFSCKGRALCPSCNARRMAETAAHLVDHVFPPLPVRQWVLSVPKRLRWYLQREPKAVSAVLHILLRVIEAHLRQSSPGASARARLGAVSFVHRFGSSLNRHTHYHCCILDGVFEPRDDGSIRFLPAAAPTPQEITAIAEQVRRRVLRWFARSGLLDADDARDMLGWDNGGFSLDASVCIAGEDRAGLERLLRYCARPPFALERLEQVNAHQIVYHLPRPRRDGCTALSLTPLELIDHLAALIPPPRLHRHRYHGVLAPSSPLRAAATAYGREHSSQRLRRRRLARRQGLALRRVTSGPCCLHACSSASR